MSTRSRGNVLYVRELVTGALADGALVERDGLWRLLRTPPPTRSLVALVGARMTGLAAAERHVVELLALGEPLHRSDCDQGRA